MKCSLNKLIVAILVSLAVPGLAQDFSAALLAAVTGDIKTIKSGFADGSLSVDSKDPQTGGTLLGASVIANQSEIVTFLIEQGADVNKPMDDGSYALHIASFFGYPDVVKALLEADADVFVRDAQFSRPINVLEADWAVTQQIASIFQIPLDQETLFAGREVIRDLLIEEELRLTYSDPYLAALSNDQTAWETAKSNLGDVNEIGGVMVSTVLGTASIAGNTAVVSELIGHDGIDLNLGTADGNTPLHMAAFTGKPEVVQLLIDAGADVAAVNNEGTDIAGSAQVDLGLTQALTSAVGLNYDMLETIDGRAAVLKILGVEQ